MATEHRHGNLARFVPIVILVAAMIGFFTLGWHKFLTLDHLIDHRTKLMGFVDKNYPLALLSFALIYIVAVATSLPGGLVLTLLGGLLFGWLVGGTVVVVAATIGATLLFVAARTAFGETLRRKVGPRLAKVAEGFEQDAFHYLLFLRLVPAFPFWFVNLAPAFTGIGLGTYVLATFLGIIPGTFAFAVIGSGLDGLIVAQEKAYKACMAATPVSDACGYTLTVKSLVTPGLLAALGALGALALVPVVAKRWLRKAAPGA